VCSHGSSDVVENLATKHPELINSVDEENNNGLHLASRQGSLETVMYLIETLKMDPSVRGLFGRNSFINACYGGHLQIVKKLATKHPELINTVDENNDNGLHLASGRGSLEIVMYLIETLTMDPTVKGEYGRNSFIYACYGGKLEIVKYLATEHPELINTVDEYNYNGLHLASRQGNLETVMYMIESLKMDPAVNGSFGRNSYINACSSGKLEIVKYLATKYPALINTFFFFGNKGYTPHDTTQFINTKVSLNRR